MFSIQNRILKSQLILCERVFFVKDLFYVRPLAVFWSRREPGPGKSAVGGPVDLLAFIPRGRQEKPACSHLLGPNLDVFSVLPQAETLADHGRPVLPEFHRTAYGGHIGRGDGVP